MSILESFGVPKRFILEEPLSTVGSHYESIKRVFLKLPKLDAIVIKPFIENEFFYWNKPRHKTVGWEKRVFWRNLAKINKVEQVSLVPEIMWKEKE